MRTNEELEHAALEDAAVDRALAQAYRAAPVATTPESIEAGDASIAAAYRDAPAQFQQRVESKELLTAEEFCRVVGVDVDWLDDAVRDGRSLSGSSRMGFTFEIKAISRLEKAGVAVLDGTLLDPSQWSACAPFSGYSRDRRLSRVPQAPFNRRLVRTG
jgi:hypothetical protein